MPLAEDERRSLKLLTERGSGDGQKHLYYLLVLGFSGEKSVASEGSTPVAPEWVNPLEFKRIFVA